MKDHDINNKKKLCENQDNKEQNDERIEEKNTSNRNCCQQHTAPCKREVNEMSDIAENTISLYSKAQFVKIQTENGDRWRKSKYLQISAHNSRW